MLFLQTQLQYGIHSNLSLRTLTQTCTNVALQFDKKPIICICTCLRQFLLTDIKMLLVVNRCVSGDNATLSEFEEVLKAMNMPSLIPLAPRIFDLFDDNRDGTVDMREILCGFSSFKNSKGDDALRLCFQVSLFS